MITEELLRLVQDQFALSRTGIHGVSHWQRVYENGMRLAPLTGANPQVVELFAFLHDACRLSDGSDREHGQRAAEFARTLAGSVFTLESTALALLLAACSGHTAGLVTGDITVLTCWDADRLDLGRVGIMPRPERLGTAAARDPEIIAWAYARSRA